MLYDQTGSGESFMVTSKPVVTISQLVDIQTIITNGYVFKVQLSNGTPKIGMRLNRMREIQYGSLQTGSNHISACRHDTNTIPTATDI